MERFLRDRLPNGEFSNVAAEHQRIMKGVRGKGNRLKSGPEFGPAGRHGLNP